MALAAVGDTCWYDLQESMRQSSCLQQSEGGKSDIIRNLDEFNQKNSPRRNFPCPPRNWTCRALQVNLLIDNTES